VQVRNKMAADGEPSGHHAVDLQDAGEAADEFCVELGKRTGLSLGFLRTILLRRLGSSIVAGRSTGGRCSVRARQLFLPTAPWASLTGATPSAT
jgi:hypothetical protein